MVDEHTLNRCIECGALQPKTNTNYTLISSQGWRLTRSLDDEGRRIAEWHCPACWSRSREVRMQHTRARHLLRLGS
jgi:hypothetical protein